MALSVTPLGGQLGAEEVYQSSATGTSDNGVASSGALLVVEVDNSNNTVAAYLKLYDHASPTVGTTAPNWVFLCPANVKRTYSCPGGSAFTNLSLACVTTGGTAGTASPTNAVTVRLVVS